MKFLANYIMGGLMKAVLVTSVTALLSLLIAPLSYLSGAAVGLVTLRVSPQKGLLVAGFATVAVTVLGYLALGAPALGPAFLAVLWLPVWVLARTLRRTVSLPRSLLQAALFGLALVGGIHILGEDPAGWWQTHLHELFAPAVEAQGGDVAEVEQVLEPLSRVMTGVTGALVALSLVLSLLLARWWQALLYNPGGFREEFHSLRLPGYLAGVALALMASTALVPVGLQLLVSDLLIVLAVLFVLEGLAVTHGLVGLKQASIGWLVGLYVLLLIAMPQMVVVLALAGFCDLWFDFRRFFGERLG